MSDKLYNKHRERAEKYLKRGKYYKRKEEELKAYKIIKAEGSNEEVCNALMRLGDSYRDLTNYEKATKYYLEADRMLDKLNNQALTKKLYLCLINCFSLAKDYDQMLFYVRKVTSLKLLTLEEEINLYHQVTVTIDNISEIETYLLKLKALLIKNNLTDGSDYGDCLLGLGTFYYEQKEFESARKYLEQGSKIFEKLYQYKDYLLECYLMLGEISHHLNDKLKFYQYFHYANEIDSIATKAFFKQLEKKK